MTRMLLVLLSISISGASSRLAAQSIISNTTGLVALREIIQNKDVQVELEISPAQLAQLTRLLDSQEVREASSESLFQSLAMDLGTQEDDFGLHQNASKLNNKDIVVALALPELLESSQLEAMRVRNLQKQKIRFPLDTLHEGYLLQIGMNIRDIKAFRDQIDKEWAAHDKEKLSALRLGIIAGLLTELPDASRKKFVWCFGRKYVSSSMSPGAFDESSIGVFLEDRGSTALRWAALVLSANSSVSLPSGAERFSDEQALEFGEVYRAVVSEKLVPVPGSDPDKNASQWIAAKLTLAQRKAVALFTHVTLLEDNLNVIVDPRVYRFLELPNDSEASIRHVCTQRQEEIDAMRVQLESKMFKAAIAAMPPRSQEIARLLYDNVWCDLSSN